MPRLGWAKVTVRSRTRPAYCCRRPCGAGTEVEVSFSRHRWIIIRSKYRYPWSRVFYILWSTVYQVATDHRSRMERGPGYSGGHISGIYENAEVVTVMKVVKSAGLKWLGRTMRWGWLRR